MQWKVANFFPLIPVFVYMVTDSAGPAAGSVTHNVAVAS